MDLTPHPSEISETDKIVWYSLLRNFSLPISYLISKRRSSLETLKSRYILTTKTCKVLDIQSQLFLEITLFQTLLLFDINIISAFQNCIYLCKEKFSDAQSPILPVKLHGRAAGSYLKLPTISEPASLYESGQF